MDPVTHVATGVALSQLVRAPSRAKAALAGFLFAVLPDLDFLLAFNDRLLFLQHHRGFSHSLPGMFLFVLLGAGVGRLLGGPRWFRPILTIGFLVLASHLFLDWVTSYGTQLLNPFTNAKYSLDWVFIIDPYLTALVLTGAIAALWSAGRGRKIAAVCLSLAGVYVLLCGFYHHQALNLARRVFQSNTHSIASVAALPQPFTPRRWQLLAVTPGEIRQAFVALPYWPWKVNPPLPSEILVKNNPHTPLQVPPASYHPPKDLEVYCWRAAAMPAKDLPPEARPVLETYLGFARFPLLAVSYQERGELALTWLDLRFSIPGRALPFTLHLRLDQTGNLASWRLSGGRASFKKPPAPPPRPG
jgi:membrane-bound metal-dependent hydrolase YbcI (DUF457 family)